jgi:alkanesulfonate monooxygenase SsuD/methylene tetrahydromethanopterin reductase-like flavin-dependent oxidoreductase (luciferase family)
MRRLPFATSNPETYTNWSVNKKGHGDDTIRHLCSHESYQREALVEQAILAERVGFDMILGSDHFHPWDDDESAAGFVWSWLDADTLQHRGAEVLPRLHEIASLPAAAR